MICGLAAASTSVWKNASTLWKPTTCRLFYPLPDGVRIHSVVCASNVSTIPADACSCTADSQLASSYDTDVCANSSSSAAKKVVTAAAGAAAALSAAEKVVAAAAAAAALVCRSAGASTTEPTASCFWSASRATTRSTSRRDARNQHFCDACGYE